MHCSVFLVGGLKRAQQIFFFEFFVLVVLFRHNYGPVNQKKITGIVPAELEKSTSICAIDLAVQPISRRFGLCWRGSSLLAYIPVFDLMSGPFVIRCYHVVCQIIRLACCALYSDRQEVICDIWAVGAILL